MRKWKKIRMPFFDVYERRLRNGSQNAYVHFGVLNEGGAKSGAYPGMEEMDALSFTLYVGDTAHALGRNVPNSAQFHNSQDELENLYRLFSDCIREFDRRRPELAEKLRQGLDRYRNEALYIAIKKQ